MHDKTTEENRGGKWGRGGVRKIIEARGRKREEGNDWLDRVSSITQTSGVGPK